LTALILSAVDSPKLVVGLSESTNASDVVPIVTDPVPPGVGFGVGVGECVGDGLGVGTGVRVGVGVGFGVAGVAVGVGVEVGVLEVKTESFTSDLKAESSAALRSTRQPEVPPGPSALSNARYILIRGNIFWSRAVFKP